MSYRAQKRSVQVTDFEKSQVGRLVPISGHDAYLGRDYKHFAFVPAPLPSVINLSMGTHKLAEKASMSVGRLDFAVKRLPDPRLLVRPALRREAQSTSALEGTYATLEEVLEADYVEEANRSAEVREVLNYVRAAEQALELVQSKPICLNVIAPLQATLVDKTARTPGTTIGPTAIRPSRGPHQSAYRATRRANHNVPTALTGVYAEVSNTRGGGPL